MNSSRPNGGPASWQTSSFVLVQILGIWHSIPAGCIVCRSWSHVNHTCSVLNTLVFSPSWPPHSLIQRLERFSLCSWTWLLVSEIHSAPRLSAVLLLFLQVIVLVATVTANLVYPISRPYSKCQRNDALLLHVSLGKNLIASHNVHLITWLQVIIPGSVKFLHLIRISGNA